MKLLSIDLETTGTDTERHQILEMGAVIFDPRPDPMSADRWQFFECLIDNGEVYGEAYALAMNAEVLAEISGRKETHRKVYHPKEAHLYFSNFLSMNGFGPQNKAHLVGKNFDRFDLQFLKRYLAPWDGAMPVRRRALDLGSVLFDPDDGEILTLAGCLEKMGFDPAVKHRALDDAIAVANAVKRFYQV